MTRKQIAGLIDHTLLKSSATRTDIEKLCKEALEYGFCSVCVNPVHVKQCSDLLAGSKVKVCTVAGFPLGANRTDVKLFETERALFDGAVEIDMVAPIGFMLASDWEYASKEIAALKSLCGDKILKVILETCLLPESCIVEACRVCIQAGADFVKTSTGFSQAGATPFHISLMRKTVGKKTGVKASGGIKTAAFTLELIENGANRIGTSSGIEIINDPVFV